jgi:hypothetical protein
VTFTLRRATLVESGGADEALELAVQHAAVTAPRRGEIAWGAFDRAEYAPDALAAAAQAWSERARQEYHSMALFTQLASQVHLLGAPLDWSGAFARMIADEVRHTEICARMSEQLVPGAHAAIDASELHLPIVATSLRAHVRGVVVAAFCIGETLSGRMFRRCLRAATVPLARDVVRTIVDDETFHGQLGWELAALLMREDEGLAAERDALAGALPRLFAHYRRLCGADPGRAWADEGDEADAAPNFGTLTRQGYARAFYTGMREDVVPGLIAIGFPEAAAAWDALD